MRTHRIALLLIAPMLVGCTLVLPEVSYQPVVHNPFPQLSKVAIAPFFNQSDAPTVDGQRFALAYFAELQSVPGYEVVPVGVVEETIIRNSINLSDPQNGPSEARRLAGLLGVDAVVIGSVTDYSPYYPPRCGIRVEWYAANPGFHPIPAGYGLPWGTPEEEYIPPALVFEAEMALAREQMATQTPDCSCDTPSGAAVDAQAAPTGPPGFDSGASDPFAPQRPDALRQPADASPMPGKEPASADALQTSYQPEVGAPTLDERAIAASAGMAPVGWPDARGFSPAPPSPVRPACLPQDSPVMTHTRIFLGNDPDFTAALANYVSFRDDARFGGWQSYLERSDDFIRFCCHQHILEMLSARGGGGETQVVRRWSERR
ncbi:hypothetical protein Pla175_44580 [Pirellulimonas nuda]|uniref:Lipoprotein n=1 Tax=Pirellulimonas nuda TaxID=2528009 RepID=A0A518DHS9_9BACT|nr:hypothetical protein [Pirellulimonas nuda]QDU91041.1 hypothetical protein Pla175_44580 [Pirellulimonas nuda]